MKKKLFSTLLCLCMILTLLPTTAWATEPDGKSAALASEEVGELVDPQPVTQADSLTYGQLKYSTYTNGYIIITGCDRVATDVVIPAEIGGMPVKTIENFAFDGCSSLTSINISDSVELIGDFAFHDCTNLKSVRISNSVTKIGIWAFFGCSSLPSVTIPNSVTSIGEDAFQNCSGLTSVTIPNSVLEIKSQAFQGCSSLPSVIIPNSIMSIESSVFWGCSNMTSVTIPNSVISIESNAFHGCNSLTDVYYTGTKAQWESIKIEVGNDNLTNTTIHYNSTEPDKPELDKPTPNEPTSGSCGPNLTWDLDENGTLTIFGTGKMTDYSYDAPAPWLDQWEYIKTVKIENGVENIGNHAFASCMELTNVTVPSSVTSIGDRSFAWCLPEEPLNINLPQNGLISIGEGAFYKSNLPTIKLPDTLLSIGDGAFYYSELEKVTLPSSIATIGELAFATTDIRSIEIPTSLTSIGPGAFSRNSLKEIRVDSNNPNYIAEDDVLFNKDKTELVQCLSEKSETNYIIPDSVAMVGPYAFYSCRSLLSITIPDSVTLIGTAAFCNLYKTSGTSSELVNSLEDVYYTGTKAQWENVKIEDDNDGLTSANFHYESKTTKPVIDAPDILKDAIFISTSTGAVSITIPETVLDAPAPIQNVLCAFSDSRDASGPASEYKTGSITEQSQTIQITPEDKNYRTVKIFTLDKDYRPVCKPTIVQIPASD